MNSLVSKFYSLLAQTFLHIKNVDIKIFTNLTLYYSALNAVTTNAIPLNVKDGWTLVPTRSGFPIPVKLANALSQPELYFNVENDVLFELYTLKNKQEPQILSPQNISTITSSHFNKTLPTRIYIHGWQEYAGNMKKCFNDGMIY